MEIDPLTGTTFEELTSFNGEKWIRTTDPLGNITITAPNYNSWTYTENSIIAPYISKPWVYNPITNIKEEDLPKMNTYQEDDLQSRGRRYRVTCHNDKDLLQDKILKNLSVMKSKLMFECAPVHVKYVECKMTPAVKNNIIAAYKRLNRYGKELPFVARFDDYGRRLEDKINIETLEGMKISIVNPEDYGELYLEFTGVVEDLFHKPDPYVFDENDLPF